MTKIKLCGMKRHCDIDYANELMPDYIGFVFAPKSKRYVTFDEAEKLRLRLNNGITPVGVFVDETQKNIENLVKRNVISVIQLHGSEDNEYIKKLRTKVDCPIIKAFRIESEYDIREAEKSEADFIMLDSGGGTGKAFRHSLIGKLDRNFFLAGGLDSENVYDAILTYQPYAVDASSSLETDGVKDKKKMAAFVKAVRYGKDENR
ncbi:MAG: phosphoribosylanthranilate isomerase [Clostridia bacterium]